MVYTYVFGAARKSDVLCCGGRGVLSVLLTSKACSSILFTTGNRMLYITPETSKITHFSFFPGDVWRWYSVLEEEAIAFFVCMWQSGRFRDHAHSEVVVKLSRNHRRITGLETGMHPHQDSPRSATKTVAEVCRQAGWAVSVSHTLSRSCFQVYFQTQIAEPNSNCVGSFARSYVQVGQKN